MGHLRNEILPTQLLDGLVVHARECISDVSDRRRRQMFMIASQAQQT